MGIRPLLSALSRHKLVMWLLIVEVALTYAIVCNAVFLIVHHLERMQMPSGIAERELVVIDMAYISGRTDANARAQADLAALRQIPGVRQVALVNTVPLSSYGDDNTDVKLEPQQRQRSLSVGLYLGKNLLRTMGTRVIAGRRFQSEEFTDLTRATAGLEHGDVHTLPHVAVISRAMAQRLWPDEAALGKTLYIGKDVPLRVIGILARLVRSGEFSNGADYSMAVPISINMSEGGRYLIRCAPQDRTRVLKAAVARLERLDPNRVLLRARTFDQVRGEYFQGDRAMAGILVGVCLALLIVTALGIVGLASFWVAQRRKNIGIHRALGATRGSILRYFQIENFLIVTCGIALGAALAIAINLTLVKFNEMPRLPFVYLPVGAAALWCLGQLAILGPALRASGVPPMVATRSV